MVHQLTSVEVQGADQREQDAQYYRGVLHGLIDIGADLARQIHQQGEPVAEIAIAFDRIARSVRRCVVLAQKIAEPVGDGGQRRAASRRQIIRAVEDEIQRHADEDAAESLHAEFCERLDGPELDDELDDDRPVAAIIADICRDLGLAAAPGTHPWKRRSPADVAVLCARARSAGAGGRVAAMGHGAPSFDRALEVAVPPAALPPDRARFRGS